MTSDFDAMSGPLGDWAFLFREQLTDALDKATPPAPGRAAALPMRADIAQIISDGYRNGRTNSEIADAVLREFEGVAPVRAAQGGDAREVQGEPVAWRWKYKGEDSWQHCSVKYTPPPGVIVEALVSAHQAPQGGDAREYDPDVDPCDEPAPVRAAAEPGEMRAQVIEECARFIEQHQERISETSYGSERSVSPRMAGNQMGLAFAAGLRALSASANEGSGN